MCVTSCAVVLGSLVYLSCSPSGVVPLPEKPAQLPAPPRQSWVDSVLAGMSLEDQVGQLMMVGVYGYYFSVESDQYVRLERLVREYRVGGVIVWPGDVMATAVRLNSLQRLSRIPLLVSGDFERGHAESAVCVRRCQSDRARSPCNWSAPELRPCR